MSRLTVFLFLLLGLVSELQACFTPIVEEQYNSLILFEKLDDTGNYSFKIPSKIDERRVSRVYLHFGLKAKRGSGRADEWLNLVFNKQGEFVVGKISLDPSKTNSPYSQIGDFPADKGKTYFPYIHVIWDTQTGFGCPIVAKSSFLGEFDV
jgi:hypothetical protein